MFNKLRYKFSQFMMGRYGMDDLYRFLIILLLIVMVINAFFHSEALYLIQWIILIYSLFRAFSKNISARQKENAKFLIWKNSAKKSFNNFKARFNDKDHVYKKCPHCKATLRFPRRKGKHNATCPRCRKEFKVHVWY